MDIKFGENDFMKNFQLDARNIACVMNAEGNCIATIKYGADFSTRFYAAMQEQFCDVGEKVLSITIDDQIGELQYDGEVQINDDRNEQISIHIALNY